jgi:hypothetical protein
MRSSIQPGTWISRYWLLGFGLAFLSLQGHSQDYSKFSRCNEASKQASEAGESLNRSTRERLLYDLYIDLLPLFQEHRKPNSKIPKSLRTLCIQTKWNAYLTALENGDDSFKSSFKIRWQTAELEEAFGLEKEALKRYALAASQDPNNSEVQMKYFKIWDSHERKRLNLNKQVINNDEIRRFVLDSENHLKRINSIRDSSRETKIEATIALCDLYRELSSIFKSSDKLLGCYENLLLLEPNNEHALRTLADYYLAKGLPNQAAGYLSKLQNLGAATSSDRAVAAKTFIDQRNFIGLLKISEGILEKNSSDKVGLEYKAIALQELGRKIELSAVIQQLRKVNPRSDFLREVDALKVENAGDDFNVRGLPGNALASYQSATKLLGPGSHNLYRIQRKIALIIYENHKADNFSRKDAVAVDMKEVVKLLSPVLKELNPDPEILRTGVKAAYLARNHEVGVGFCEKLFSEFASLNNKPELLNCADIFIAAGQTGKAKSLLDQSRKKSQYSSDELDLEMKRRRL